MNKFTTIVFDLDGTLVNSRPSIEKAVRMALAEVLPSMRDRPVVTIIGPPIRQMFCQALGVSDEETLNRLVAAFRRFYDAGTSREAVAYPGVLDLLNRIRGRGGHCFVLTNKPWRPTCQILEQLEVLHFFREVVTPDSPDHPFASKAQALAGILQRHGAATERTLMVGDSHDDAAAARACGIPFVAATYGYGGLATASQEYELTITAPQDILNLLENRECGCGGHDHEA